VVAEPLRTTTNPRTMIVEYTRQLVDRAVERPDRVSVAEIMTRVEDKFLSDTGFMQSLALMNVREVAQAAIREGVASTRGPARRVIVRDIITTPLDQVRESKQLMASLALRWGRFREWNGVQHVVLPAMKRPDLLAAAAIRRERAARELAYAIFWESLASRLPDDDVTVGERIPYEEIELAYATARQQAGANDPGEEDQDAGTADS
jgi:hypothetical protein